MEINLVVFDRLGTGDIMDTFIDNDVSDNGMKKASSGTRKVFNSKRKSKTQNETKSSRNARKLFKPF